MIPTPPAPRSGSTLVLVVATGFWARLCGLHAFERLSPQVGLWLSPCNAIHTFGLAYDIDVIFLDAEYRVARRIDRLTRNRMAFCFSAATVVELPGGYCARHRHYLASIVQALDRAGHGRRSVIHR